jgi:type IV pilus assembly protein PilB
VLKEAFAFPKSHVNPIISRLKIMSKLDISEKRLPQDGRIRCLLRGRRSDFRVSTLPGRWGEKVVLRALESDSSVLNLSKLITEKKELNLITNMSNSPYGIVIVVGPTGSGKSTTLYSMLSALNKPGVNISTVEDPVEYTLDGIHQVQVIREKGLDFSRALRSLMRQDPDIILVGETRDKETAQAAMEAALTGHMVFTTLHANDTATAITRLAEMEIPPYLIGSSIIGVVAQRLVRKVCKTCSELKIVNPKENQLAFNLGVKKARFINKSNRNCSICNGTGYKGRVGIYEVMKVHEDIRELIMKQANADEIREKAFQNKGRSLLVYGMNLVENELTTIEEVERVCLLSETTTDEL